MYGYRLSKIDPAAGHVLATLAAKRRSVARRHNVQRIQRNARRHDDVAKAFYRQAGCTVQGPNALTECPDPSDVPNSVVVTVDPDTMKVIDQTTLPADVIGRVTMARSTMVANTSISSWWTRASAMKSTRDD